MTVPRLSVDWFANGGILTKPTIFGQNGNSLMVGGEAGERGSGTVVRFDGVCRIGGC